MVVADENGNPIQEAVVKFANYKIALKPDVSIKKIESNESGQVFLNKKSYTQIVVLAADGGHSYDWSYCIEKEGYFPVAKNNLKEAYFRNGVIVERLAVVEQRKACKWQEYPHGFIISTSQP